MGIVYYQNSWDFQSEYSSVLQHNGKLKLMSSTFPRKEYRCKKNESSYFKL